MIKTYLRKLDLIISANFAKTRTQPHLLIEIHNSNDMKSHLKSNTRIYCIQPSHASLIFLYFLTIQNKIVEHKREKYAYVSLPHHLPQQIIEPHHNLEMLVQISGFIGSQISEL